jgi:hypothetical protein
MNNIIMNISDKIISLNLNIEKELFDDIVKASIVLDISINEYIMYCLKHHYNVYKHKEHIEYDLCC